MCISAMVRITDSRFPQCRYALEVHRHIYEFILRVMSLFVVVTLIIDGGKHSINCDSLWQKIVETTRITV